MNGDTVLYASANSLKATLEYDFEQERKFKYKGLNEQEIIEHIAFFISNLWQIHIFGEGNTRTTAIFLIKYLRKLGFKNINNNLFADHSWYFRNSLVRANFEDLSNGIHKTDYFLIRFLSNLILKENFPLKNRDVHIFADITIPNYGTVSEPENPKYETSKSQYDTVKYQYDTVNRLEKSKYDTVKHRIDTVKEPVLTLIQQNNKITAIEMSEHLKISLSTIKRKLKVLKNKGKIKRIGSDKTGHWEIIV